MTKGTFNRAVLIGRVGGDPEIWEKDHSIMAQFCLGTIHTVRDKELKEIIYVYEWHRLICYGKLADVCKHYIRKGHKIFIEGRIQARKYLDKKTGKNKYSHEILVQTLQMLNNIPDALTIDPPDEFLDHDQESYD